MSVNEIHHLVLFTRALRSILVLQLLGERHISQSVGVSVCEKVEETVLLSHNSHVATAAQVRHCLGMQPMMQAHSAPADCGSRDLIDLCCSANRASLIYIAALVPWLMPAPVPANIRQRALYTEPEPCYSQPQGFYQLFNSLATSPPSYYHWIPVG